jgi:hypothetical protein
MHHKETYNEELSIIGLMKVYGNLANKKWMSS